MQAARGTASITSFYSQQKKPASTPAPPTQATPDLPEPLRTVRPPRGLAAAMGAGAKTGGAVAGWPGGADLAPQPNRQTTLQCVRATQSDSDHQQSAFKLSSVVLSQSDSGPKAQGLTTGQTGQGEVSSTDVLRPLTSHRSSEGNLGLQSPYAMRLRQLQGVASAQLRRTHSSSSGLVDAEPSASTWRQPDPCSRAEPAGSSPEAHGHQGKPAGSSPRAQPYQDKPAAAQRYEHRAGTGHLEIGRSLGHPPNSPDVLTPKSRLFTSPKRSMGCQDEDAITILSDSQSQEELEIALSPSPAKRYAQHDTCIAMYTLRLVHVLCFGHP